MKVLEYLKARLVERSTYMFWLGSLGTVVGYPAPFSYFGAAALFMAGLVPDGPVK